MVHSDLFFFFFVIVLGYLGAATHLLPKEVDTAIPALLINFSYPAMIFSSFSEIELRTLADTGLFVAVATAVITTILLLSSKYMVRNLEDRQKAVLRFQIGIGNVVYVSIPLLGALFGPSYFYIIAVHSAVQDLYIWLIYLPMVAKGKANTTGQRLRSVLTNPSTIVLFIALVLRVMNIAVPSFIKATSDLIGSTAGPIALLYLGYLIHKHGIFRWIRDPRAIRYAVGKTIALPIIVALVLMPFTQIEVAVILGMLFGAPAPIMSIVWASHYDGDPEFAVDNCISSTVIYIAFISIAGQILLQTGMM